MEKYSICHESTDLVVSSDATLDYIICLQSRLVATFRPNFTSQYKSCFHEAFLKHNFLRLRADVSCDTSFLAFCYLKKNRGRLRKDDALFREFMNTAVPSGHCLESLNVLISGNKCPCSRHRVPHSFSHSSITVQGATLLTSSSPPWGKKKP